MTVRTPPPAPDEPQVEQRQFVGLDTDPSNNANVWDLLQALNQLKVPIADRIAILTEIQRAGKLHAKLVFEE